MLEADDEQSASGLMSISFSLQEIEDHLADYAQEVKVGSIARAKY